MNNKESFMQEFLGLRNFKEKDAFYKARDGSKRFCDSDQCLFTKL